MKIIPVIFETVWDAKLEMMAASILRWAIFIDAAICRQNHLPLLTWSGGINYVNEAFVPIIINHLREISKRPKPFVMQMNFNEVVINISRAPQQGSHVLAKADREIGFVFALLKRKSINHCQPWQASCNAEHKTAKLEPATCIINLQSQFHHFYRSSKMKIWVIRTFLFLGSKTSEILLLFAFDPT